MNALVGRFPCVASEFPDYPLETLPEIPDGWHDSSWHNDVAPSFMVGETIQVFVDYADQSQSEWAGQPDYQRFHVLVERDGDWQPAHSGNDWSAVMAAVAAAQTEGN